MLTKFEVIDLIEKSNSKFEKVFDLEKQRLIIYEEITSKYDFSSKQKKSLFKIFSFSNKNLEKFESISPLLKRMTSILILQIKEIDEKIKTLEITIDFLNKNYTKIQPIMKCYTLRENIIKLNKLILNNLIKFNEELKFEINNLQFSNNNISNIEKELTNLKLKTSLRIKNFNSDEFQLNPDKLYHELSMMEREIEKYNQELEEVREKITKLNFYDLKCMNLNFDINNESLENLQKILNKIKNTRELNESPQIQQLVAIHMTDYFPENGKILTSGHYQVNHRFAGEVEMIRETIHFALNGTVGSLEFHKWEKKKFAIIIPLEQIIDRIICLAPHDSYILGNLNLPEGSEIVIKKPFVNRDKTIEEFQNRAGKAKVLYSEEAKDLQEGVCIRLSQKFYTPMKCGEWGWKIPYDKKSSLRFKDDIYWSSIFKELGKKLNKITGSHGTSFFGEFEEDYYRILSMINKESNSDSKEYISKVVANLNSRLKKFNVNSEEEREAVQRMYEKIIKISQKIQ